MLTVCTWLWGNKYGPGDVAKLAAGVRRNIREPHRFIVISDCGLDIADVEHYAIAEEDRSLLSVKVPVTLPSAIPAVVVP